MTHIQVAPPRSAPCLDLSGLNNAQRHAVEFGTGEGFVRPLLVIAGAGSGKTNTLAHRVAHLVAAGIDPGRILLLTFSRRAADEMIRRASRLLGQAAGRRLLPWAGTFHGVGARLLREFAGRIGLSPDFTIHDREDSADLMNLVRHELGFSDKAKRFPLKGTCLAIYSAAINTRSGLADVLQGTFPWCAEWADDLEHLFGAYVSAKQAQEVLDYDDLLLYWAQMAHEPALAAELGDRFSHVLVDEYQDTNRLQAGILLGMKPTGAGLTVVGDDAQAIYAFRGATVRNILDFPQQFEPPAQIVTLERNYRSTQAILDAANAVIGFASERFTKDLWSERPSARLPALVSVRDDADQASYLVERILARREEGIALKSQAILFRASSHSARLELELTRRNIPFVKFGGLKFLEAAHVKDVLAVLRWSRNPLDRISGFRAVQLMPGVGPRIASRILDDVAQLPAGRVRVPAHSTPLLPSGIRAVWQDFSAVAEAVGAQDAPWPGAFERLCQWYLDRMADLYEDAAIRQPDIEQLARIAATYPGLERFLTELTLDPPEASSDQAGVPLLDEDYLILSTVHSAKGQEWKAVSVLNVVDGCVPSDIATGTPQEIEEERRLLYVAMTRARDHLDLVVPQRFRVTQQARLGDRHVYGSRTRFIPNAILCRFEQVSWPVAASTAAGPQSRQAAIDLAAKMRAMWQ